MNLIPLSNHVIVKRDEAEGVSKGGIVLPEKSKEKPQRGKVLSVGPGKPTEDGSSNYKMSVKAGDSVIFSAYAGHEFDLEGQKVQVMTEDDILAIVQ